MTTTTLKPELLNEALDVNGIGLNLPGDAIGVVGSNTGGEFRVLRNGTDVTVKPGDVLLKGDTIITGNAVQTIFLSSPQAVAMTKVALAANQQLTLNTDTELTLQGEVIEVAATEALNPEILAMAEGETSGLFGMLGAASIAGVPAAGLAAGGVALAAVGGSGGGSADSTDNGTGNGNNSGPGTGGPLPPPNTDNGDMGGTPAPAPEGGGAFSGGGAQIDDGLAGTPLGGALPFSFADGGAQLEGALPVPVPSPASTGNDSAAPALPVDIGPDALAQAVTGGLSMIAGGESNAPAAPDLGVDMLTAPLSGISTTVGETIPVQILGAAL